MIAGTALIPPGGDSDPNLVLVKVIIQRMPTSAGEASCAPRLKARLRAGEKAARYGRPTLLQDAPPALEALVKARRQKATAATTVTPLRARLRRAVPRRTRPCEAAISLVVHGTVSEGRAYDCQLRVYPVMPARRVTLQR
jgi:hypothetical protein